MAKRIVARESECVQAVLYARYSPRPVKKKLTPTGEQKEKECESVKVQLERLHQYCEWMEWEIVGEFSDEGKSGATVEGRDGLEAAIALACRKKAVLVVTAIDRLSRDSEDGHAVVKRLGKCGAKFAAVAGGINTTTDEGELVFSIMLAFGSYERKRIGKRTSESMRSQQARGGKMSKEPPYGKMLDPADPSRWVENPAELPLVNEVYRLADAGELSVRGIAREVSKRWRNRKGRAFKGNTIQRILERRER